MKLDGEKLLAEIERKIKLLWRQIDSDIECQNYESITSKYQTIQDYRRIIRLIDLGDYTIEETK
jgi:hypothetical protein